MTESIYQESIYQDSLSLPNADQSWQIGQIGQIGQRPRGYSHWRQYGYARTGRVPFCPIAVSQMVGFSSNVPLRVGFGTPNVCQRGYGFCSGCARKSAECKLAKFSGLHAINCANEPFLSTICATEGTLFVPVIRVWIRARILCNQG